MTATLPFLTPLTGIGGRLKAVPAYFIVTELPEPRTDARNGKHCLITVRRSSMTTPDVRCLLGELFSVRPDEIGYAGLKDTYAIATQSFTLPRDRLAAELRSPGALDAIAALVRSDARLQVVGEPSWQQSKLRIGELAGNHFEVVVSDCAVSPALALERAQAVAAHLQRSGWANFYGPQRFGRAGPERAKRRGAQLLLGRLRGDCRQRNAHSGWLAELMLAAMQSALFVRPSEFPSSPYPRPHLPPCAPPHQRLLRLASPLDTRQALPHVDHRPVDSTPRRLYRPADHIYNSPAQPSMPARLSPCGTERLPQRAHPARPL